jgi:diguanylate cyclase (GGDEF)-like protein
MNPLRPIIYLLVPLVLLAIAYLLEPSVRALPPDLLVAIELAPFAAFAAGLALAFRFNRSRTFFVLLTIAIGHAAFMWLGRVWWTVPNEAIFPMIALFLAIDVTLFSHLEERGIFTWRAAPRFALLALQAIVIAWLAVREQPVGAASVFRYEFFPAAQFTWTAVPQPTLIALQIGGLLALATLMTEPNEQAGSFAGTLGALVLVLHRGGDVRTSALFFGAAALGLVISVIQKSYQMAYLDELTGLAGRRALKEELQKLGSVYTIAMADVDHFKKFNDNYGHDMGDDVLRLVGARLQAVSGGGIPFRYGGEEFAVLFPGKKVEDVRSHLEGLREKIATTPFMLRKRHGPHAAGAPIAPAPAPKKGEKNSVTVTISIGLAQNKDSADPWDVVKKADQALYRAKQAGRNRVEE